MSRKKHVIIVAGGKGLRMGGEIPKQFLPIGGKPVLMRTIEAFYAYDASIHVISVLPVSQQSYWKELCAVYAIWLGLFSILEKCGLAEKLSKLLSPIINKIFGKSNLSEESKRYVSMNISANLSALT